jgi:hypothetical protein
MWTSALHVRAVVGPRLGNRDLDATLHVTRQAQYPWMKSTLLHRNNRVEPTKSFFRLPVSEFNYGAS